MADEGLSSALADSSRRVAELAGEAKGHRLKAKEYRAARDEAMKKLDTAHATISALTKERDDYKTRLDAAPSEQGKEIERLRGELRTRDHRAAFDRAAKAANVREEALEDLWQLSGYKAEADQVDDSKITGLIGEAVKARPWLVQAAADAAKAPPAKPAQAGPGGSRGVPSLDSGGMVVRHSNLRDANWMRQNQAKMAEAHQQGVLTIIED